MPPLKRLLRISFAVLFTVVLLNLVLYFLINHTSHQNKLNEEGENTASSQQIYMQQIVGKIAALSIHHHFSEDQFANQLNYLREATQRFRNGQEELREILAGLSDPDGKARLFQQSDTAYAEIYRQAVSLLAQPQKNSDEWSDAGRLYAASGTYLPLMKSLHDQLRADELASEQSMERMNSVIIISLVGCLLWLIVLVIAPIFRQSARNYEKLQRSLEEVRKTESLLQESEQKYRYLFEFSPMPMWIFDRQSLRFLEVNHMAVRHYGFSAEEFTSMTILDIRPREDHDRVIGLTKGVREPGDARQQGSWMHRKKDGQVIFVEIISHPIEYNGRPAMLILAKDVTRQIELQKELVEEQIAHQREIARATVTVQEKERNEIGRELHDNVNQILTSVKLHLEFMGQREADTEKHRLASLGMVSTVIQEIRRLSRSLVPHTLNDVGLQPAIGDLTESLNQLGSVHFHFQSQGLAEEVLPEGLKLSLLRIIQEQTTNILKYARATEATITLTQDGDGLLLVVADNGIGFDPNGHRYGIGLTNIMNRADIYNGNLSLHSAPGQGCRLEVAFSLEKVTRIERQPEGGLRAQA